MRRLALAAGSYYRYVILRKPIGNTCVCALGNSKKNDNNNDDERRVFDFWLI